MSGIAEVSLSSDTYNQTEIGKFPIDWEVVSLQDSATFGGGTTPPRKFFDKYYVSGVHPWVKTLDLNNGVIAVTEENVTDAALAETSLKKHPAGSVLIAMYGGFNQIGRTGLIAIDAAINQALVAVIPKKGKLVSEYLLYNFNYKVEYWKGVASSSRKDPNITSNDVKNYLLPLPTVKEQTAIANALSDVDALIGELEKLIAKKQAIKTATMQQLLTGRTRLPQFALRADGTPKGTKPSELGEIPEDWEVVTLGDIGQTVIGLTYSPNDVADFGTLVLRSSNVQNGKLAYADNVYVNMELPERVIVKQGDILICVRNGSRQLIGKCALIDENAEGSAFGAFMSIFRTKYSVFVFYQFQSDLIQNQINEIMGATINQITNKDMSRFKITLPSDEKEQTDIATILSDMDAEIQALEQRLGKTRHIKQGMMQELLTGKTRLIKPSKEVIHE
ncbi:restriction endonuclease subunit S [Vibrio metschnikovii]|uniref:restriction endonuclease subunit S n=1 Tax=Vibrio metschnikovii TaxID=28172 RepID=UPI001C2FA05E|nr:restriction endonuclease subunit S [Vibrio metschnikovii]